MQIRSASRKEAVMYADDSQHSLSRLRRGYRECGERNEAGAAFVALIFHDGRFGSSRDNDYKKVRLVRGEWKRDRIKSKTRI